MPEIRENIRAGRFADRHSEARGSGARRTVLVGGKDDLAALFHAMYPREPLPEHGLRLVAGYFLKTLGRLPEPGERIDVPDIEHLWHVGQSVQGEQLTRAAKLAGEKGSLTQLSQLRRRARAQGAGLKAKPDARLAAPEARSAPAHRRQRIVHRGHPRSEAHQRVGDNSAERAVGELADSAAQRARSVGTDPQMSNGPAARALRHRLEGLLHSHPHVWNHPRAALRTFLRSPHAEELTTAALAELGHLTALRTLVASVLTVHGGRHSDRATHLIIRYTIEHWVPLRRPEHVQPSTALLQSLQQISGGTTLRSKLTTDVVRGLLTEAIGQTLRWGAGEAIAQTDTPSRAIPHILRRLSRFQLAEIADAVDQLLGAAQIKAKAAEHIRRAIEKELFGDVGPTTSTAYGTPSATQAQLQAIRTVVVLYAAWIRANSEQTNSIALKWLAGNLLGRLHLSDFRGVSTAAVARIVHDVLRRPPHPMSEAEAHQTATNISEGLERAAGDALAWEITAKARYGLLTACLRIDTLLDDRFALARFTTRIDALPDTARQALAARLGLDAGMPFEQGAVRRGLQQLRRHFTDLREKTTTRRNEGLGQLLAAYPWATAEVAKEVGVRLSASGDLPPDPSIVESGLAKETSFGNAIRALFTATAGLGGLGFGAGSLVDTNEAWLTLLGSAAADVGQGVAPALLTDLIDGGGT